MPNASYNTLRCSRSNLSEVLFLVARKSPYSTATCGAAAFDVVQCSAKYSYMSFSAVIELVVRPKSSVTDDVTMSALRQKRRCVMSNELLPVDYHGTSHFTVGTAT